MSEEEIHHNIIGLPETIFMTLLVGVEELAEFFILVITLGLGIMVVEAMNGAMGGALEMYMVFRGGKGVVKLVVQPIGTFINGISGSLLPGKTVAMLTGIWVINHPEMVDKVVGAIAKVGGQVVTAVAAVATGGAGGVAAKVVGGGAAKIAEKKVVEAGASAARARMATASGASSGRLEQVNRLMQARARAKQSMSEETPQGIPENEEPLKEAA